MTFLNLQAQIYRQSVFALLIIPLFLTAKNYSVKNADDLQAAIQSARPGDEIIMNNGTWKDVVIDFNSEGVTVDVPIIPRAESSGHVVLTGSSTVFRWFLFSAEYI